MNRKVVISKCDHCPYYDNFYYSYEGKCVLLDKHPIRENGSAIIPNECPLEETDDDIKDNSLIIEKY